MVVQAVGESVAKPLFYYENNIGGLLTVLKVMVKHGVKNIVFSSSATVYGAGSPPCTETSPTGADIQSPYGQTKFMAEVILRDFQKAHPDAGVVLLRYFNPVGAHASGTIGEDPAGEAGEEGHCSGVPGTRREGVVRRSAVLRSPAAPSTRCTRHVFLPFSLPSACLLSEHAAALQASPTT